MKQDRKAGLPMGKKYYDSLRDLYQSEEAPTKKIKIGNEAEILLPAVEKALLSMLGKEKDISLMSEFFEHGIKIGNQKTMAVLARQMAKIPPLHPAKNTHLLLAYMSYLVKHGLNIEYPAECAFLRDVFDAVLGKTFSAYKNSDLSAKL